MPTWSLRVATIVSGIALLWLTAFTPARRREVEPIKPMLLRPEVARTVFKPALPLIIDLYWLRTINAVGEADTEEKNAALNEYAQLITGLDPKFRIVYWFVAISMPWWRPDRTWVLVKESNQLLRAGLVHFPDDLKMNLLLGYNLITYDKDYIEGAKVFAHAATLQGAPPFAGLIATRLFAQGGSPDTGLELAIAMRDSAADEATRAEFEKRIQDLEIERILQKVDVAIAQYREKNGKVPADVDALRAAGFYDGPTEDPVAGHINIGYDERSHAANQSRRLELYLMKEP